MLAHRFKIIRRDGARNAIRERPCGHRLRKYICLIIPPCRGGRDMLSCYIGVLGLMHNCMGRADFLSIPVGLLKVLNQLQGLWGNMAVFSGK